MPWIEGFGDEVTIFFSIVFFICILVAAWFSTGIRDIPFISVIIVQWTRRGRRNQEQNSNSDAGQTVASNGGSEDVAPAEENGQFVERENEITSGVVEETIESVNDSNQAEATIPETSGSNEKQSTSEPSRETSDKLKSGISSTADAPENLSSVELRQRRLDFIRRKAQTCENDNQADNENEAVKEEDQEGVITASCPESVNSSKTCNQVNIPETVSSSSSSSDSQINDGASVGSGHTDEEGAITVKIKFLNETQMQVEANLNETIGSFRRRNFSTEISESKLVRFIYNGQDLRNDSSTLQSYNIGDNSVLHCLVTQPRPEDQPSQVNNEESGLDIGVLMFPLFGLLLSIVWYLRFSYRQLFNVTSTLTLGGISFLYIAALLSSLRAQRGHEHID